MALELYWHRKGRKRHPVDRSGLWGLPEKKGSATIHLLGRRSLDSGGYSIREAPIVGMNYDKCGALACRCNLVAAAE